MDRDFAQGRALFSVCNLYDLGFSRCCVALGELAPGSDGHFARYAKLRSSIPMCLRTQKRKASLRPRQVTADGPNLNSQFLELFLGDE